MKECSSFEIWGNLFCGWGPPSWEGVFMGVVCGKVSGWVGKFLAKTPSLRLGWEIEWNFGQIGGLRIFLSI